MCATQAASVPYTVFLVSLLVAPLAASRGERSHTIIDATNDLVTLGAMHQYPSFDFPSEQELECMSTERWKEATGAAHGNEYGKGYEYVLAKAIFNNSGVIKVARMFLEQSIVFCYLMRLDSADPIQDIVHAIVQANRGMTPKAIECYVIRLIIKHDLVEFKRGDESDKACPAFFDGNVREFLNMVFGTENMLMEALAKLTEHVTATELDYNSMEEQQREELVRSLEEAADEVFGRDAKLSQTSGGSLNVAAILKRRLQINSYCEAARVINQSNVLAHNLCDRTKGPNLPSPAITKFGSLTTGWVQWLSMARGGRVRTTQTDTLEKASSSHFEVTTAKMLALGMPISKREMYTHMTIVSGLGDLHQKAVDGYKNGIPQEFDISKDRLLWQSGGNVWTLNDIPWPDDSMGYVQLANKLGMRKTAGPSGTTNRLMQYGNFLGMSDHELFILRLGIMGWFVSTGDHSAFEVLLGASDALPRVGFEHDSKILRPDMLLPAPSFADEQYTTTRNDFMAELASIQTPDCHAECPSRGPCPADVS